MKKLKGSIGAIKMKYLIFVFAAAVLVALPTRVYQLLALIDVANGFYNSSDITIPVLYGAVFVFACIFMVLSFLSKEVPSPKLPTGKNPILGVTSIIMTIGLGWDIFSIERRIIPQVQGEFNMEIFKSLLSSNLEQNGGLFTVLRFVFAVLAIFYFFIFAVSHLNGKASYKEYKILALSPLCWAITGLISKLMTAVSFLNSSELLFEIFMFVFAMLFLLTFARISTGVFTEDSMWGVFGYGFAAAFFAALVTIPRLVCAAVGAPLVENYEFNFVYLAMMLFIISYIIASLGVGFKDGIKNIKTISEVELPSDSEVVVKRASSVAQTASVVEEFDFDDAEEELEDAVDDAEDIAEEAEEKAEDAFEDAEDMAEEAEDAIEELEETEGTAEAVYELDEEDAQEANEAVEDAFEAFEKADDAFEDAEDVAEDAEDAIETLEESGESVEGPVYELNEEAAEEVEEVVEDAFEAFEEADDAFEDAEDAAEIAEDAIEDLEEAAAEDTAEVAADAFIDEPMEETLARFETITTDDSKVESSSKKNAPKKPKAKKERKGLFGSRKPSEKEKPVADDLKPISLADLRKKNEDDGEDEE